MTKLVLRVELNRYRMKTLILLTLAAFSIAACTQPENFALPSLARSWQETEPEDIYQLEGSTFTQLQLNDDNTFVVTNNKWTDALRIDDPCRGIDEYFAFGIYSFTADSLYLEGCYSDKDFNTCIAQCNGKVAFKEAYQYALSGQTLTLNPDAHPMIRRIMEERGK